MPKVLVIGGGIGGLTAAHELLERGFEVSVYDIRTIPGGKSRTIPVPNSGKEGRPNLPGEHGFRFVPAFYRHLPDSMKRIPFGNNRQGCFDNLTGTTYVEIAPYDKAPIRAPARFPRTLAELLVLLKDVFDPPTLGLLPGEIEFFAERLWQVMTSCQQRRLHELENQSWWEFTDADHKSPAYVTYLVEGLSRSLVAAQPKYGSARTIGQVQVHLIFGTFNLVAHSTDQVLNGPTSAQLLDPWIAHIRALGGRYTSEVQCTDFDCQDGRIASVGLKNTTTGATWRESADYYVSALPVEVMGPLVTDAMVAPGADPSLQSLRTLDKDVRWMNGLQFFLKKDVPVSQGHTLYVNSPWAITSISEAQFWTSIDLSQFGDGTVRGILSVDISDWTQPGTFIQKKAEDCNLDEIAREVWQEIEKSLNVEGKTVVTWDDVHSYFLDTDIEIPSTRRPHKDIDVEPLFINEPGSWEKRPSAGTAIENLLLAADYVQTNADLACMDSANEAARRAVNAILDRTGSTAPRCRIWDMEMPLIFAPLRLADQSRFDKGEPWSPLGFGERPKVDWSSFKAALLRRTPPTSGTATPRLLDPQNLPASEDGYHLAEYEQASHLFWYTEWWYFDFYDKKNDRGGMVTFAIFNGADIDLLGVASLNAAVFDKNGTGTTLEMDYHSVSEFWASSEKADVDLAGSTIRVLPDGPYEVRATTADGAVSMGLTFTPADEPQLLADGVHAEKPWEFSSWLAWMPSATVSGWVSVHGQRFDLTDATGYHDHDWGIWYVPGNTWAWAAFSIPERQISFDVGLHAAFQKSTAYLRVGDLRLSFPQDSFQYTFGDWAHWKLLWKYPKTVNFTAVDSTGRYQISLIWEVQENATLWKYPLLVFEQTAQFKGSLTELVDGIWKPIATFDTTGFSEYTSEWIGGGPS